VTCGGGGAVHNFRAIDWKKEDIGFDWAHRFDDAAKTALTVRPSVALEPTQHPDFSHAVPIPDHFYPLLYLAGLASAARRPAKILVDGYAYGSLSMTSYTLDSECPRDDGDVRRGADLPDPAMVPPEDTNL